MDKDDVEDIITLYKYLFDKNIVHDKDWKKNMPKPRTKFRKQYNNINVNEPILEEHKTILTDNEKESKEINKADIKKTLNYLKQEIERLEKILE
jgi:hypothetical protein